MEKTLKTAEEILQYHYIHDRGLVNPNYVVNAMQDYARQVAEAVREECIAMARRVHGTGPAFDIGAFRSIKVESFIK